RTWSASTSSCTPCCIDSGPLAAFSDHITEQTHHELPESLPERAALPALELDGPGVPEIPLEDRLHAPAEVPADDDRIDFIVVQEAAHVEIRGAYDGDGSVDDDAFGMQQRILQLV